jgi:hypothetical protein
MGLQSAPPQLRPRMIRTIHPPSIHHPTIAAELWYCPLSTLMSPMKRKLSPASTAGASLARRTRQPQISCDFCRHKKLKCGPERPCPNCLVRNQPCHGSHATPPTSSDAHSLNASEILERLRRLEQAVFLPSETGAPSASASSHLPDPVAQNLHPRRVNRAKSVDLDYPEAPDTLVSFFCSFLAQVPPSQLRVRQFRR